MLSGLSDGLKNAAATIFAGGAARKVRANFPIPIVEDSPEHEVARDAYADAAEIVVARDFDGFLTLLRGQLASRETTGTGLRLSEPSLDAFYAGIHVTEHDGWALDQIMQPLRDWYARAGSDPDVAALVARALQIQAHSERGDDWAENVSRRQWQAMSDLLGEAQEMLVATQAAGKSRELWHRTWFKGGLLDAADPQDLRARFEEFVVFDPGNVNTYFDRAQQLLPRWYGSYEEIEHLAQQSIERTRDEMGAALYSEIYLFVMDYEDMNDTHASWDLLVRGFQDGMEKFSTDLALNKFTDMAARCGHQEMTRNLFNEMPELRLDAWSHPNDPFEAYAWAHDSGPWPYSPERLARRLI